ncbi:class I SAM-dependent methyltransferase [Balneola sp. MJW-20]|uniref:class I SAM-dependent methyltransferase n=1 Tax=Gracilimonas aurantiaca TaxID=3234185 RepID=UPI0034655FF8
MILGDQSKYYKFHSHIYDYSRWSFLFGRKSLLDRSLPDFEPHRILDIGSGTGYQLKQLYRKFSESKITGIELSGHMIKKAHKKLQKYPIDLIRSDYIDQQFKKEGFDMITASYSLTMMSDHKRVTKKIHSELKRNGVLMIVDFYDTPFNSFRNWMKLNHVSFIPEYFDKDIPETGFKIETKVLRKAYGGLWSYVCLIYRKI